jgi:hypothetical protein
MKPRNSITVADAISNDWLTNLVAGSQIALGHDVATTTKEKSNPSSLAVVEKVARDFYVRLLIRWKTADPGVSIAVITRVLDQLKSAGRQARRLSIDASNEKFHAANLKKEFSGRVSVALIVSGETTQWAGEEMSYKIFLGNLYINTIDDGHLALPDEDWVAKDARLVKRDRGTFVTELDASGNHGDAFDAVKLGLYGLVSKGGRAEATGAPVGEFGRKAAMRPGIRNPYARLHERRKFNV